ncbi:hypothetical protein KJ359_008463 [Pestalotiopsis sp. 9143b]|nr:hypothetical protein KJ359_008463 [Pestalotiopsis sp. 9143b]
MSSQWQEVVKQKRSAQKDAIDSYTTKTQAKAKSYNEIPDIATLQQLYTSGEADVKAVVSSYIEAAIAAHNQTNCLTEICFDDAVEKATALDAEPKGVDLAKSPLHGVPMTLKDQFNVMGYDSTLGYVGRALKPAESDAILVKMLRSLGGVVLAKTNLPQSIMWCETDNPLWGLTTNPVHPGYTPGGSTGGESALLALKGSMAGWGTDIGGSIRIPSHMMGIYGFKPSSSRLPYNGVPVSTEGQEHVPSSVGPMARSLSSIKHVMHSLISAEPWQYDARCATIPWRDDVYQSFSSKPLTIGLLLDDGVVRPHPPVTRVLRSAAEALRAAGHDVFEWDASLHPECIAVMDAFYSADGGMDIRTDVAAAGEPFIPHVERLVNRGAAISVYEYWQLNRKKWALQQAYLEKWKSLKSPKTGRNADILILPPMPHPSVPHGGTRWVGYTKIWNVLDYTALVIPGGKVESQDTQAAWDYDARNETDEWNAALWTKNRDEMAGLNLPIGVQIVGRKLEEEKVLAAGKVLDDLLRSL